jgi:predicted permease
MSLFVDIVSRITLPLVLLMGLGYVLERKLKLDVATLSKLLVYAVLPCALIHFLTSAALPLSAVGVSAWFAAAQFFALLGLGWLVARLMRLAPAARGVFALAVAFPNSGNYGLPLVELAYGGDYIMHQSVITSIHSILIVTVGVLMLSAERHDLRSGLRAMLATPLIPSVVLGLAIKGLGITLPDVIALPLKVTGTALTPIALFTLGAQIASATNWSASLRPVAVSLVLRMAVAPALTWAAAVALAFPPDLTSLYVVGAATPVGVLLVVFAAQYESDANLATAMAVISTILSPIVVTVALALAGP